QNARTHIEAAHNSTFDVRGPVVADRRTDDKRIVKDGRWRCDLIVAGVANADTFGQVHFTISAETGTRPSRVRVNGDEAGVNSAFNNAFRARSIPPRLGPVANAT